MCLSIVYAIREPNTDEITGYKVVVQTTDDGVFYTSKQTIDGVFYTSNRGFKILVNEWVTSPEPNYIPYNTGDYYSPTGYYPSGFHIFVNESDAKGWLYNYNYEPSKYRIVEVKGKDIRCVGRQRIYQSWREVKVYVCKQIKIEGEKNVPVSDNKTIQTQQ